MEPQDEFIKLSKRQNRIKNFLLNFKIIKRDDSMECLKGILTINKHFRVISYSAELYYLVMFKMVLEEFETETTRAKLDIIVDRNPCLKEFKLTDDDIRINKIVSRDTVLTRVIYDLGI